MPSLARLPRVLFATLLVFALSACAGGAPQPLTLTIAHVNDTHSALEASDELLSLRLGGVDQTVRAKLGGFARLKTALDQVRTDDNNALFLHAGDAVQGTLYFNLFQGAADFDFLNALGLDAMAIGNHEFDKGPGLLGSLATQAHFPLLSANLDASREPTLAGRFRPYIIRNYGAERVAIVGLTTPATPLMTASVGQARFLDPAATLRALLPQLKAQNINKVVVLSHCGYEVDLELARTVPGMDLIIGGHSHTLLGDRESLAPLGLKPAGAYPTQVSGPDGAPVLVVQAWKWGEVLGLLTLRFDAKGQVTSFDAAPKLLLGEDFRRGSLPIAPGSPEHEELLSALKASKMASITPEDPGMLRKLLPYKEKIATLQNAALNARASVDLIRGTTTDPGLIMADAYLAKIPGAQLALVGAGGQRRDLPQGELTLGMVLGVSPFGNTLVTLGITGAQLAQTLEDAVDFRLVARPDKSGNLRKMLVMHSAGFCYTVHPLRPKGQRIDGLRLLLPGGGTALLDPAATYRLVTNSFLAGGGDGLNTLKELTASRVDTGFLEHDALAEHLTRLGTVEAPAGPRVIIELPEAEPPVKPQSALPKWRGAQADWGRFSSVRQPHQPVFAPPAPA